MVTPTDPQVAQEQPEQLTDITPIDDITEPVITDDAEADAPETEAPAPEPPVAPATETAASASFLEGSVSPEPPAPQVPTVDQQALNELQERRSAEIDREWRDNVGRQARQYEQQLQESGYMPEQARDQARRYVMQEQKFREKEKETSDMLGFVQGRQAAAAHFMKKHKLANQQMLEDLNALQRANTPAEMEREARRMQRERALLAENARLKQGRVAPQTFDNSQGAAEATTSQDRLLNAYLSGDRSDAAVQAAKKLTFGA